MAKKVVVFFDELDAMGPPLDMEMYLDAYRELADLIEAKGGDCYFVRGENTHLGGGRFSKSWKFINGVPTETGEVSADIIYDKGSPEVKLETGVEIINPRPMSEICEDKLKTYELFPELSPESVIVYNDEELAKAAASIDSEMLVIKPIVGHGGEGVEVLSKEDVKSHSIGSDTVLVQQFIDTSLGIEGITDGAHDLRLVIIGGEVVSSMVRTPTQGSLIANLKVGGTLTVVKTGDLPKSALVLADKVDSVFEQYSKRVYSIDIAYEGSTPYLIELNSRPGLWNRGRGEAAINFQEKLSSLLLAD